MAEAFPGQNNPNQAAGPHESAFGPTDWDIATYSAFLKELRTGYEPGFNPAVSAQLMGSRIDSGDIGGFIDPDNPTAKDTDYRVAQGRWAAGVLGLKVGATKMNLQAGTARTALELEVARDDQGAPARIPGFGETTNPGIYGNGLTASVAAVRGRHASS